MRAHVEWHGHRTASIRVGDAGWRMGEPYLAHVTLVMSDPPEIMGLTRTPTPAVWRAIQHALWEEGIPRATFRRWHGRVGHIEAKETKTP